MLHRLDPIDVSLEFDDRSYRLGETIGLRIEIVPKGSVTIRTAIAKLVCDQKFTESYTVSGPGLYSNPGVGSPRPDIPSQVGDERVESYAHSQAVFLSDESLEPESRRSFNVSLPIDDAPPRRWEDAKALEGDAVRSWTFTWRLVVSVDVAHGRDARVEKEVKVRTG